MELQFIEKSNLEVFVQNLMENYPVEGVMEKDKSYYYGPIQTARELCLGFDTTLIPPKKYFLPPREVLFRFSTAPQLEITSEIEDKPFILFGVHPYDLKAIHQMDQVFTSGVSDPHYLKRRRSALLIGVDPTAVAPNAFWADMEAATVSNCFDLMLTDIGEGFVVETGSEKGREVLDRFALPRTATQEQARERVKARSRITSLCEKRGLSFPKKEIPRLLERSREKIFWEEQAGKCLSCGSCNLVCPTCYCFDVKDNIDLDLVHGERFRRWDGCLLQDFAKVATGENFRESRTSRYRHRFMRKGLYLYGVLNDVACVGCGRCASACLPDIADPVKVLNHLKENETL
jgi:sulfhydrogenase subunit beta (sulfur reductase)